MNSKQKNSALLLGFFIALFIIYKFSIQNTFDVRKKYNQLLKEKELLTNASLKIKYLQEKNFYLDSVLQSKNVSIENSFQQTILQNVSIFSSKENIEIINFTKPHSIIENETIIETLSFELKGEFIPLLKLINYLEQEQFGKLLSVHFEKKKNYRNNKPYLTTTVYLQKVSNN